MEKVVIFILGYRARKFLEAGSMSSIMVAAKRIGGAEVRAVYLDNYSRDGSVELVLERYPDVDLLVSPRNYMYCKGTNTGIQYAYHRYKPDYFILVDADNYCEPDAYDELLRFALEHKEAGLIQPLVRNSVDKNVLYSCGHRYIDDVFCRPLREIPDDRARLLDLPSCSISSTLVKTEVFARCGLLDPIFEIYYESSDLSFRARNAGFKCACHDRAVTYNDGAKVSDIDNYHEGYYRNRNGLIFWKKHEEFKYQKLLEIQLKEYEKLTSELARHEFGLGMIAESTRKGIEDGMRIAAEYDTIAEPPVSLDAFDKTTAVLLQSGILLNR
ncbi:glycosyltransferase family 2 protein [Candidatus Falkowbacteria bacterium]|nr:glycosyltransferase family 2 protein [Candidatus Falkowbacteria bacterium]